MKSINFVILVLLAIATVTSSAIAQEDPQTPTYTYKQVISEDGSITFAYPEDWYLDASVLKDNVIGVLSTEDILKNDPSDSFESGDVSILLRMLDTESLAEQGIEGEDIETRLASYVDLLSAREDDDGNSLYEFDEIEYIDTHTLIIPYAEVMYVQGEDHYRMMMWNIADGLTGLALIRTTPGEWFLYKDVSSNVALSLQYLGDEYDPIQLPEEATE